MDEIPPLRDRTRAIQQWGDVVMASGKECSEFVSFEAIPDAVIIVDLRIAHPANE